MGNEYYSERCEWGNEPAIFDSIEEAIVAAMDIFDLSRDEAKSFCYETRGDSSHPIKKNKKKNYAS